MKVLIKTHGRPFNQPTYKSLRAAGFTGQIIFIVDDEDKTREYLDWAEDCGCITFNKQSMIDDTESGVNNPSRNVNLYAWQACERYIRFSEDKRIIMADDDITGFRYRYEENGHLKSQPITKNRDRVFEAVFDYMEEGDVCATSLADSRMFFGGSVHESRAVYNFVFRNGRIKMDWMSEMYEETPTSVRASIEGKYIQQLPFIQMNMVPVTGHSGDGMSAMYQKMGILHRSMYPLMFYPSSVELAANRTGHIVKIDNAYSKLVSSTCKKR